MDNWRDFNVILNEEEKLGGIAFEQQKAMDFALFINSYALSEVSFLEVILRGKW